MLSHTSPGITDTSWLLATAVAVAVAVAALAGAPATAQDGDAVVPTRVDGQSRIHTGANIATLTFDQGNGYADGIGITDANRAMITRVHSDPVSTTHLPHVPADADNRVAYTLQSDATDCAVPVAFHDGNDNQQLDVDHRGRPLEPWSYGEIVWAP